ncbi:hypothetical protein CASFOL_001212 [Castilleja foliolosa]|uniref:Uncharacterized protein n=1 Tax=Castilleja foliolosa TaxID=1961234 RepID=A0ABD3EMK8_9LAMI
MVFGFGKSEAASTVAGLAEREQPKKISHLFDESFYGTPTLITRIGTETGSLVEGTGLRPATPSK